MRITFNKMLLIVPVFIFCIIFKSTWAETGSPESAYKQMQTYVEQKEWGKVFDCMDKEAQEITDILNRAFSYYFTFGDSGVPKGFEKLSPKERFVKISATNDNYAQRHNSGSVGKSENAIIKVETKGEITVLTVKDSVGDEHKILMRLVQGVWKLHISEDSQEYKMFQAMKSGDENKMLRTLEESANQKPSENVINKMMTDAMSNAGSSKEERMFAVIEAAYDTRNMEGGLDERAVKKAISILDSLLSEGAQINLKREKYHTIKPILVVAVKNGANKDIINFLLDKGADVNAKDGDGQTALSCAAYSANKEIVEILAGKGADINNKDNRGRTVLIEAAQGKPQNKETVEFLISKGAGLNDKDNQGQTALMWAAFHGYKEIVELLVSKGADVDIKDKKGKKASDLAEDKLMFVDMNLKAEIARFLRSKQKAL